MKLYEIIKIHEEYEAVPKFMFKSGINGGVLKVPSNIIRSLPEREIIYEIDGKDISVYENKIKIRSIHVDIEYAVLITAIVDMQTVCENQGYAFRLCRIYNAENECINNEYDYNFVITDLFNLLNPKAKKKDLLLVNLINNYMETGSGVDVIPESIFDGCEFVLTHYKENKKND